MGLTFFRLSYTCPGSDRHEECKCNGDLAIYYKSLRCLVCLPTDAWTTKYYHEYHWCLPLTIHAPFVYRQVMMTSANGRFFRGTGPLNLCDLCEGNPLVTSGFPSQRTQSFNVFFDLRHRWFETPSLSLWRHCNVPCDHRRFITLALMTFCIISLVPPTGCGAMCGQKWHFGTETEIYRIYEYA